MALNHDDPLVRLATLGREMRKLQKLFFKGGSKDRLTALERAFDQECAAVLDVTQAELFPGPTGSGPYGRERHR